MIAAHINIRINTASGMGTDAGELRSRLTP